MLTVSRASTFCSANDLHPGNGERMMLFPGKQTNRDVNSLRSKEKKYGRPFTEIQPEEE
jgi:hypothetical protein